MFQLEDVCNVLFYFGFGIEAFGVNGFLYLVVLLLELFCIFGMIDV